MNLGRLIFAQLMDFLPLPEFRRCVARYDGERRVRRFSCLDQFYCLAFAQLTFRESLRDIETCLRTLPARLYHMGIRGHVSRSTLADANERRPWRIYADLAQELVAIARPLYADEDFGLRLQRAVYVFDSTTIDLCLSLFPWAHFRRRKGAVKLHTLLDLRGHIPCFVAISHGKVHDVQALDQLLLEPGAIYVMDRGYCDFLRLTASPKRAPSSSPGRTRTSTSPAKPRVTWTAALVCAATRPSLCKAPERPVATLSLCGASLLSTPYRASVSSF